MQSTAGADLRVTSTSNDANVAAVTALLKTPAALSYADLVGTLTNLEHLAELPMQGETSAEWTSWDRASTYNFADGEYVNWGANDDGVGFIRKQSDGGMVMAEMTGPGCIWRIWSAQVGSGRVKIFLDDSENAAVDLPFEDYFNRRQSPFDYASLVYQASSGFNSYVPIPYNKSCKVVAYGLWGRYFHINYSSFPPGVSVPTFKMQLSDSENRALSGVDDFFATQIGSDPAGVRQGETNSIKSYAMAPAGSATVLDVAGSGAITGFKIRVNKLANRRDQWRALRELTVSMFWDGETNASVWAPLGDFFGTPCGLIPFAALPIGVQNDGWMYCYWYMPFASHARITLGNDGSQTRNLEVAITRAPLEKSIENFARFHAKWNRGVYLNANGRAPDYEFLNVRGKGRFVGLALHVYQKLGLGPGPWWGEGDEKFFVDGEKMPSWFGTGSEDYFGFAWGTPGYFTRAFHTQLLAPPGNLFAPGNRVLNRFQIADNVPFQTAFEGCLEKFAYTNDAITAYALTPYWYASSDSRDPYDAQSLDVRTNYFVPDFQMELPDKISRKPEVSSSAVSARDQ